MAMVDADGSCHFRQSHSLSRLVGQVGGHLGAESHQINQVNSRSGFAMTTTP